jgi:hypothetical protein
VKFETFTSYVGTPLPVVVAGLALVEVDGVVADDEPPLCGLELALLLQPATNSASAKQTRTGMRRAAGRRTASSRCRVVDPEVTMPGSFHPARPEHTVRQPVVARAPPPSLDLRGLDVDREGPNMNVV